MTDHDSAADPDIPDTLTLEDPAQYRALFEDTRLQIVALLRERAATTSELAAALDKPKGTVGHHLKVLEEAGLVRVVRRVRVRALEAKYYGRTARTFLYSRVGEATEVEQQVLADAAADLAALPADTEVFTANTRQARIPAARAAEWLHRLNDLLVEFADQPREGEQTYSMVVAIYPTDRPRLPETTDSDPS